MEQQQTLQNREATMALFEECTTLNPRSRAIRDGDFRRGGFFDPHDVVQVKYEMLRRHRVDGLSVTEVAALFGVSRQTFYKIERAFEERGLSGLMPAKGGPRGGWKCTGEVLDFVQQRRMRQPDLDIPHLIDEIEQQFDVTLHPNTLRYALSKGGEKARMG